MEIIQKEIALRKRPQGFHLVTDEIILSIPEIKSIKTGIANLLLKHTSASLTLNENADPDVRTDMQNYFKKFVPDDEPYFIHTSEGSDDMSAHIKSSLLGNALTIPITNGEFNLGIWQGIYLCEHRVRARERQLVITIFGE